MNRVERLTATMLLLQAGRRTAGSLADELGVSRRTVIRDVESLSSMGVPVIALHGAAGGYELAREFTLAPLHLTGREALLLMLAVDGLARMADTPFAAERASLLAKLRALMPEAQRERVEGILERVALDVPTRAQRAPLLDQLVEAAASRNWLRLRYDGEERTVRADRVTADRGHWYLHGLCEGKTKFFRADRVEAVEKCDAPDSFVEPLEYGHPSHPLIRVRLTAKAVRIVERDPHLAHALEGPEPTCLEFRCPPEELDWYARYFGGMGTDARVEEPPELIERIVARARALLGQYIG